MAKIYGQLEKAQLENLSADPTPASTGLTYWNTTLVNPRVYDGTTWQNISLGSSSVPTMNVRASEGAGTTTLTAADNPNQKFDLSAGRNVNLPTTSISKGDIWTISNPNPFQLKIRASDASDIIFSWGSGVTLVALVNAPATNTDWAVVEHDVIYGRKLTTYTPTISSGSVTSLVNVGWSRVSIDVMYIHGFIQFGSGSSGTNALSVSFPAPGGVALTFDTFIQGQGDNLGSANVNFNGTPTGALFGGFTTVSGVGTATDLTFYSGYSTSADATIGGNSGVVPVLEGHLNTLNSYISFNAYVRIAEWKES